MEYSIIEVNKLNSTYYECQNLLEINAQNNHEAAMHRPKKIIVSNTIKRKAEVSSANLRKLFNDTFPGLNEASSVTFKYLESSTLPYQKYSYSKNIPIENINIQ